MAGVADAIAERRQELGMNVEALVEATGVTRQGLAPLLRGERRAYQERLTMPVCRALRWTPDSIARLLDGEPAKPLSSPVGSDDLPASRQQLTALAGKVEELVGRFDQLQALVLDALGVAAATSKRPADQPARQSPGGPQ